MSQTIKKANIFGRIGTGLGKGLAEQIPKEIERERLSSGLNNLAQQKGLNPLQQLAGLYGTPGVADRPELVKQATQFLRTQADRDALMQERNSIRDQRTNERNQFQPQASPQLRDVQFGQPNQQQSPGGKQPSIPSGFQDRGQEAQANPERVENPYNEKYLPKDPWNQEQKREDILSEMERNPRLSFEEAKKRSDLNEQRYLEAPEQYGKQREALIEKERAAATQFDDHLRTLLQKKEGEPLFGELSGDLLINAKKAMYKDLATNPALNERTAGEKWAKKAKDLAVTQNKLRVAANRDITDRLRPSRKEETLKGLSVAQKAYGDLGELPTLNNILISDFDLSPGYSALITYPRSPALKQIIKESNFNIPFSDISSNSKKIAQEWGDKRTGKDSVLAFARSMKDRHPLFDETAFFDYLRDNQDELNLGPEQTQDLQTGISDMFRNWGDLALFPLTGRSILHE